MINGKVFDVAVDLCKDSETYGIELIDENKKQFYSAEGFAHGFLVLSEIAEFCYKVTDFYHLEDEDGLAWNDPTICIDCLGVMDQYKGVASAEGYTLNDGTPITLSEKAQKQLRLKDK